MDLAIHVSQWSKDPSTKVGAVIVDPTDRRVVSMGYNGFPRGVDDSPERYADRDFKLMYVAHAERNALDQAECSVKGHAMYATLFPCNECCKSIIQRGIRNVYTCVPADRATYDRWAEKMKMSNAMLHEAGVGVHIIKQDNMDSEYELMVYNDLVRK